MKKNINIIITVVIAIILIMLPFSRVEASSFTVSNSSVTLDIEKSATITINASTHTGRINISSSDSNIATVNTGSLWVENNSQTITISAKSAGNATITISGLLYDTTIEAEQEYTKTINVTVNKVQEVIPEPEPEPETPTTPEPEPETPVEETPNFVNTNKTMYAENDMYLRASWSTQSKGIKISKGTEINVTATSNNTVNKYVWYRVTYQGNTYYAASNLLKTTKPTEETSKEETPTQEPEEQEPVEEPTTVEENNDTEEVKDGLKSLEIEGITLTPAFSPDIYEYRAIIKEDISELAINAITASEGATITIAGNKIDEGENLIAIVVYNTKGEVEATYQISVNKNTLDLSITDAILKNGTLSAKRERTIYITIFTISFVGLIVVMILRSRFANNEYYYEDDYENDDEFTQNEQTVENIVSEKPQKEQIQETMRDEMLHGMAKEEVAQQEIMQESMQGEIEQEIRRTRREKRKGKHF